MAEDLRIGLIGLDTSHVIAFSKLLNREDEAYRLTGARIVAGFPGGTGSWAKSVSRVDGFTAQLGDAFDVAIEDTPEAVAARSDLLFITAVDGREHRSLVERVIGTGKPIFVDKPFATSVADAQAMLEMAERAGVPLMSCSPLRYAAALTDAMANDDLGPIQGLDVFGPMSLEAALPGLFWYGCHGIEMIVTVMGADCKEVRATSTPRADVITARWDDGRVASYRGLRDAHTSFGATIHRANGFQHVDIASAPKPNYACLLEAILQSLPNGYSDVPAEEMIEVVRLMVAGNKARQTDQPVILDSPARV